MPELDERCSNRRVHLAFPISGRAVEAGTCWGVGEGNTLVKGLVGRGQKLEVDGGDAVVERQAPLHLAAFREAEDGHVRPVVAQQRRHVALRARSRP